MTYTRIRLLVLNLVIILAVAVTSAAHAQVVNPFTGTNWNNPVSSSIDTIIRGNQDMRRLLRRYEQPSDGPNAPASTPLSATSFTPAPGSLLAQTFAESFSQDQEGERVLREVFEIFLSHFDELAHAQGKPNNVAAALTYSITATYYAYTGGQEPTNEAQESLWRLLHESLADNPAFQATSDRERQELYESFLILGFVPHFLYSAALEDGDDELAQLSRTFAGQILETALRVQAQQVHFTETGLEIRDTARDPQGDLANKHVPHELIGEWFRGSIPPIDAYEAGDWDWGIPGSNGESYQFTSDGRYSNAYLEHVNLYVPYPYCATSMLIFLEGTVNTNGSTVVLVPTAGHYRYLATCATHLNENRPLTSSELDGSQEHFTWSIAPDRDDPTVRHLVFTLPDGVEQRVFTSRD